MKNFALLFLIVLIISCYSEKQNDFDNKKVNDSIRYYFLESQDIELKLSERLVAINKALKKSKKIKKQEIIAQLAYQKNWLHYSLGQYDSLIYFHKSLFQDSSENLDKYHFAKEHYLMGYYFSEIMHDSEKAFQSYTLSKGYYEQIGDSSWVGRNLLNMGTIQKDQNDFFGSKETLTEALQYLKPKKDWDRIIQCYNLLATDHRKLFNYEDAIEYFKMAIEKASSVGERLAFENNLATTFIDIEKYEDAIGILERIGLDSSLDKNSAQYARILDNLTYAKWLSGKEKGERPFLEALELRYQNNDNRGQIASYTHLGEFYSKNQPQKAKAYFDTVINLSKTIKMPRAEKEALKFLTVLEPDNIQVRDRYIFLQDSLYAQEHKVKTQFAKYKYDDKLKQQSILRLEKENAEKELEASRQRNQKIIYLGGFLFAISVFGLSMYSFRQRTKRLRQKNKTDKLMATHETEAELSRRLHDDYGGKLNRTMMLVQNDTDKTTVLDNLEALYNQTRDFSREINEVDTGPNFKEEFFEMLRFRTPPNAKLFITGSKDVNWSDVSPLTKTVLYKVLQELMINMVKHSKATLITIAFQRKGKMLRVDYADDGVGASVEDLNAKNGLRNTEKRIQAIRGTITFDSGKGNGFRAKIILPK